MRHRATPESLGPRICVPIVFTTKSLQTKGQYPIIGSVIIEGDSLLSNNVFPSLPIPIAGSNRKHSLKMRW